MMITSGNTTIEYGMTPSGQLFEAHHLSDAKYIRYTSDTERFLRWIIQSSIDDEIKDSYRRKLVILLKGWWTRRDEVFFRGSFNSELYYKVVGAKRQNGTLEE